MKAYAETLAEYPQYKLRISFRWMKANWKASNFGFPLPADFIERMSELEEQSGVKEWQGPTEKEKQEREAAMASGELADFWKQFKAVVAKKAIR